MADLRTMDIPANRLGLTEGKWLRWPELRAWLIEQTEHSLVAAIEDSFRADCVTEKAIRVRA